MRYYDIVVVGNYFCDIIFTGIPGFPTLGKEMYCENVEIVPGGPLNTVIGLRRLGVNVGWVGVVGTDFFSRFILEIVDSEGIDLGLLTRRDTAARRVTVALSYPNDRAFISYVDPVPDRADLALDALERARFRLLHFTSLVIDDRMPPLLERCRAAGVLVTMDCQHHEETLALPLVREVISRLDVFLPNASEAQRLTGTESIGAALDVLSEIVPYIVVKDGANGAYARQHGIDYHAPALPVRCIDTTGAGDVFNAGFLAAYLERRTPEECLRWGNFCGGMSTLGQGGGSNAPTRAALEAWLGKDYN